MYAWQVLIVDDGEDDRDILKGFLTTAGIHVRAVASGDEALHELRIFRYDAVVIDLAMPEMDGWQLLEQIRALPGGAQLPTIAVTAYYSSDVRHAAHRAGFNSYQPKPVSERHFAEVVLALIEAPY